VNEQYPAPSQEEPELVEAYNNQQLWQTTFQLIPRTGVGIERTKQFRPTFKGISNERLRKDWSTIDVDAMKEDEELSPQEKAKDEPDEELMALLWGGQEITILQRYVRESMGANFNELKVYIKDLARLSSSFGNFWWYCSATRRLSENLRQS
jgi:hypothetical protein